MPLRAVESRRLYQQIADQISRLIESGEVLPGTRLPSERDLAEQLGVSRPTVREALIALEVEGVLEVRGGAGVYALEKRRKLRDNAPATHTPEPFDLLQARGLIEAEAAALAATHATPEQLQRMKNALQDMRTAAVHSPEGIAADQRFHLCVAEATGNSALLIVIKLLWEYRTGPMYMRLEGHFLGEALWSQAVAEHSALLDAIASRDAKAARNAMRDHMKNAEVRLAAAWKSDL